MRVSHSNGMSSIKLLEPAGNRTTSPSSSGINLIWQPSLEVTSGSYARSIMSNSASQGGPILVVSSPSELNHSGDMMTWHVEQPMIPAHAHSMYSPNVSAFLPVPNLATSVKVDPSKASTTNALSIEWTFGRPSPSSSSGAEDHPVEGTQTIFTVFFPSKLANSASTLAARASNPPSSSTSYLPARLFTIPNRDDGVMPFLRSASTTPLAMASE
mmetsp:Transcript_31632/g.70846  ORF Transcript_31632/g.70846 Transcript_31632/m.70846 type:complete len:214 (+) Transcript_31632:2114-2755(+)